MQGVKQMCKTTEKGWIMKDGYVVPFDVDMNKIPPKYFSEIQEYSPSLYDMIRIGGDMKMIRSTLHQIRNSLQTHSTNCPVNEKRINQMTKDMIVAELKKYPQKRFNEFSTHAEKLGKVLDLFFKLAVVVGFGYSIFFILTKT